MASSSTPIVQLVIYVCTSEINLQMIVFPRFFALSLSLSAFLFWCDVRLELVSHHHRNTKSNALKAIENQSTATMCRCAHAQAKQSASMLWSLARFE